MTNNDSPEKPWEYSRHENVHWEDHENVHWEDIVAKWPWVIEDQDLPTISFTKSNSCPHCNHLVTIIVTYGPSVLPVAGTVQEKALREKLLPAVKQTLDLPNTPKQLYVWCNCSVPHPPETSTNGCGAYGYIPFKEAILKQYQ